MASKKPQVIFVLGAPGSGKGTLCSQIVEEFEFAHLSVEDLLREERGKKESKRGILIESHQWEDTVVPVEITCRLIAQAMELSESNNFLIDGFPQNQVNLDAWKEHLASAVDELFVLFLECPQKICVQRCIAGTSAGSGRSDDNEESFRKRFEIFISETMPIVEYYEKLDLVRKFDGTKSPAEVLKDVKKIFQIYELQTRKKTN